MIAAEFHRERTSIAATLLVVILLTLALCMSPDAPPRLEGHLSTGEMALTSGKGVGSLIGTVAIVGGAVALGLAVTCLVAPFAAPLIISTVFGVAGTWMAGSGTLALGVGLLGVSGVAGIGGGIAAIATDR